MIYCCENAEEILNVIDEASDKITDALNTLKQFRKEITEGK